MAEEIQEIKDPISSIIADKHDNKPIKPIKRPTIIRSNPVAQKSIESEELKDSNSSNAVNHKKPPPRPSGPPSRPTSIYKPDTPSNKEAAPTKAKESIKDPPKQDTKVALRRKPEITIVSARPLSEVIGFGKGASSDCGTTKPPVPNKRLSLNMDSKPETPTSPPPLPTNRPKGKYIPPPLPTSRPKAAYVHPVSVGSTPSSGSTTPEQRITPVPKPRSNSTDQTATNHVNGSGAASINKPPLPPPSAERLNHEAERPSVGQKPPLTTKPHVIGGNVSTGSAAIPRPVVSQRTTAPNSHFHPPVAAKPPVSAKPSSSPPKQTSMNDLFSMFDSNSSSNQSKPKNTSSDFGWQIASGIANNVTAKDVQRAAGAVSVAANSQAGRSFGNAAVKTASSSSDPKLQLAGRAAQNVNASDVGRTANTVSAVAGSEQGQKAASTAWNFAQLNRGGQNNAAVSNSTQSNTSTAAKPSSNFDLLSGLFSSEPAKPVPTTTSNKQNRQQSLDDLLGFDPVPTNIPKPAPAPAAAKPGSKLRPTIIRPGAKGSKPNSRSASPKVELDLGDGSNKTKKAPPRPSAAPQKGKAPPRPGPPLSGKKQAPSLPSGALKPRRMAPVRPAPGRPNKKSSKDTKGKESKENLPPRPGPGHPLYNYTASELSATDQSDLWSTSQDIMTPQQGGPSIGGSLTGPRAVATFSYDATSADDLSFKEGDNIKLLEKVSDEWYKGECRGQIGMFPVNFVNVIEDVKPSFGKDEPTVTSGPRCIAKYDYDSPESSDLNFPSGAVIKLLERVGDDWLKGEFHGKTGIFPSSFVDIVEDVSFSSMMPSANLSTAVNGTSSGNAVRAAYDFEAADSTELCFKEGDLVTVLNQVNSEWLYGEVRGQKGKFPAAFIEYIPSNLSALSTPTDSSPGWGVQETGVAQFDFDAANEDELSIRVGDTVTIVEYVGDDWARGRLHGKEGLFPKAFVDVGGGSNSGVSSGVTTPMASGTALYDFEGEGIDELTFKTGDLITQIDKVTEEWYEGQHSGRRGRFPAAFVDITS